MGIETDGTSKFIAGKKKRREPHVGVTQKETFSHKIQSEASWKVYQIAKNIVHAYITGKVKNSNNLEHFWQCARNYHTIGILCSVYDLINNNIDNFYDVLKNGIFLYYL